jgi:outer membrane protein
MKTIRKLINTTLALCFMLQASAQEFPKRLSLNQACQLGITNNLDIKNANLETQKSTYLMKELKSKLYPQIEGYSDFSYFYAIPRMQMPGEFFGQTGEIPIEIGTKYDWIGGFRASLMLYNQSYYTSIKVAQSMQTMSELSLQQKKEELVYQITQVYNLCKSISSQIIYMQELSIDADHLLDILKLQNENGVARKIDYSKVLVTKNNLQTQIDNLTQLHQQQIGLLKFLTGIVHAEEVELIDSLSFTQSIENLGLPDFTNRTEIKLLDKQIEVSTLNRKANQQLYLPTLSGSGQFYYDGQLNNFNYLKGGGDNFFKVGSLGISLSLPIFDGYEKRSKSQQFNIELKQLENTRKNTSDNYAKDFTDAIRQYKNSLIALQRQQENIKIAEEDYNITLQGFRQQIVLLSDLMLSANSLSEARLSFVNALLQLKNAELDVKKAKGELLNY